MPLPMPSPHRLAAALALLLVLGGLGVGGLGLLQASAATDAGDATFQLPAPHVGDRGTYLAVGLDVREIRFDRLAAEAVPDAEGRKAWATLVRLNATARDGEAAEWVVAYKPGTDEVSGILRLDPTRGQAGAFGANVGGSVASSNRTYAALLFALEARRALAPPCGMVPPLGSATFQAGRRFAMEAECGPSQCCPARRDLVIDAVWREGEVAYAKAHDEVWQKSAGGAGRGGGNASIGALGSGAAGGTTYWYRSDVPYAVRIDGVTWSLRLQGFTAGAQPVRQLPTMPVGPPAPPLVAAPWDGWQLDESGITHAYPLSQALDAARADADVAAFLDGHPEAYVASAHYRHLSSPDEGEARHVWRLTFSDGRTSLDATAHAIERDAGPGLSGLQPPRRSVEVSAQQAEDAEGRHPLPSLVPTRAPTVASLWDAWRPFAGGQFADAQANDWGFDVRCRDRCARAELDVHGGHTLYARRVPHAVPALRLLPEDPVDLEASSRLAWAWGAGAPPAAPTAYEEERVSWHRPGNPAALPGGDPVAPATRALWVVPSAPGAAAVGLGALAAALLYAFWPALKAAPVALFSRIRGPQLLDHPLRAEILARIQAEPGIHHRALARAVGRGKGSVEHHLRKLDAAGLVRRVQGQGFTCYFVGAPAQGAVAASLVARAPMARAILDAVASSPGLRPADVARRLGASRAAVHYHIDRLRKAGLLRAVPVGAALALHPGAHSLGTLPVGVKGSAGTG